MLCQYPAPPGEKCGVGVQLFVDRAWVLTNLIMTADAQRYG